MAVGLCSVKALNWFQSERLEMNPVYSRSECDVGVNGLRTIKLSGAR